MLKNEATKYAIEIATALMAANMPQNGYGTVIEQADSMAEFYLRLEQKIQAGLERQ